jgi:hypothetical protein
MKIFMRDGRPPAECGNPRNEFAERERFNEVIVGPAFKAFYSILDPANRRQKKNWRADPRRAQALDYGKTVHARQHAVNDQHVEPPENGMLETGLAIVRNINVIAMLYKTLRDEFRRLVVVFDEKNAHIGSSLQCMLSEVLFQLSKFPFRPILSYVRGGAQSPGREAAEPIFDDLGTQGDRTVAGTSAICMVSPSSARRLAFIQTGDDAALLRATRNLKGCLRWLRASLPSKI